MNSQPTPEDDDDSDDDSSPRGTLYITREGAEKLRAELKQLLSVERPKVTAEVSFAASLGDRSENAEYIYGKKRLREIDRRLRFLQKRLEQLTVIEPSGQTQINKVFFGATVTLRSLDHSEPGSRDDLKVTYQLVGPDETDIKLRKISVDSPVGRALIGRVKGDVVTVKRPKGEIDFEIVSISYRSK